MGSTLHLNIVVDTTTLLAISKILSKEFTNILPNKHHLWIDDHQVLMAVNIVFVLAWPEFFAIEFQGALVEHAIQIRDNVQPFPLQRRHYKGHIPQHNFSMSLQIYLIKV